MLGVIEFSLRVLRELNSLNKWIMEILEELSMFLCRHRDRRSCFGV